MPHLVTQEWLDASPDTLSQMVIYDTEDAMNPSVRREEMPGWDCASLEVAGDRAYCALNRRGVEIYDLVD